MTSLLLASKYDEVDDNITTIRDLRSYVQSQLLLLGKRDPSLVPTYKQIVECEGHMLASFEWDLTFMLPLHFLRLLLANGILFSNELKSYEKQLNTEDMAQLKQELTRALAMEAMSLSDLIMLKAPVLLRQEKASDIAAAILYFARNHILFSDR